MELPIDGHKLTFIVSEPSTPRRDFNTGEQRTDKATGRGIWDVVLLAGNGAEASAIKVKMLEDIPAAQMTPVTVEGLRLVQLQMRDGAKIEYFVAERIAPAAPAGAASPGGAARAPQGGQSGGPSGGASGGASGQGAKAGA